jgi:acid stress-induced BolA-like protein IbaG/YrbA
MNSRQKPIKQALEAFCREYTGRDTGWQVETWLHPITRSVQAAIVMPEFENLGIGEKVNLIYDYLQEHLPDEHRVHLGLAQAMTPDEYERAE